MNIKSYVKQMNLNEARNLYKHFLLVQKYNPNTISTSCTDAFFLWRKKSPEIFWEAVENKSEDKKLLLDALKENTTGNSEKLVNGYRFHLDLFRKFLKLENYIPTPSQEEVEKYLKKWDELENYTAQEEALDKLFFKLCPKNEDFSDILLKASTLNDFYSTQVYDVYKIAKRIENVNKDKKNKTVDARLNDGDLTLVDDIRLVKITNKDKEKEINYFSFASKYCSHHNPKEFPIYDSYVKQVLWYFHKREKGLFNELFEEFNIPDNQTGFEKKLKSKYSIFKKMLERFQETYGLENDLKLLDRYLWLLGKDYFPNPNYKKDKKKKGEADSKK